MKRMLFLTTLLLSTALAVSCDSEDVISETKLPASSQEFIKTHFPGVAVTLVMKETDGLEKDYTVYLANGFDIDFEKKGNWDDIDGHIHPLPQSILELLPAGIVEYVSANFNDSQIVEVNKERYGYEIGLSDRLDLDLKFNASGSFIGYDD
jgi:hypothetical protein